jgi:hypothetical protein
LTGNAKSPNGHKPPAGKAGARVKRRLRIESRSGLALLALISASIVGQIIASLKRSTIIFFPDEYLHSELSRSISSHGLPLVRGALVLFPSLLQPIVTAPCWLAGSVETGFRASMILDSVVMSLAALPVYWLGRRLGLSGWLALAAAALALATPSMIYSYWLLGEPFAYPFFLAGFALGVLALSGERRWLVPALVVFAIASVARIQLLVLPIAFALATLLMAAREHRFRRFLSEHRYLVGAGVALALAALVIPSGALGFYRGARNVDLAPGRFTLHLGTQLIGLLFASAWIVLPGALIGLALVLYRPRSRVELSFACATLFVTIGLLLQASLFGAVTVPQERYVFYCVPLLALCLALLVDRGWPLRRVHALLMLSIPILVALLPLSTYASGDRLYQSSFLYATFRLEQGIGIADAALLIAVVISVLAVLALALPFSKRLAGSGIFALAIALSVTALAISASFVSRSSASLIRSLKVEKGWVDTRIDADRQSDGTAFLLQGYSGHTAAPTLLFWNRSVDRVALLPDNLRPDILSWPHLMIGEDGALSVDGKQLTGPLVIDSYLHTVRLRGAVDVGKSSSFTLWLPRGLPRFSLYASGLGSGAIGPNTTLRLWPEKSGARLAGFLSFRASVTPEVGQVTLSLKTPGAAKRTITLKRGGTSPIRFAVCSKQPWRAMINANRASITGTRLISARASTPVWHEDATACAATRRAGG